MATRLAVKQLRIFCMTQPPRRRYFLVSTAKRANSPSYFTGSKQALTSILSSRRRGRLLSNIQRSLATSKDGKDGDNDGDEKKEVEEGPSSQEADMHEEEEEELDLIPHPFSRRSAPLAEVTVPDDFPEVPVLALSRQPLFPKFVKILEVSSLVPSTVVLCSGLPDPMCMRRHKTIGLQMSILTDWPRIVVMLSRILCRQCT